MIALSGPVSPQVLPARAAPYGHGGLPWSGQPTASGRERIALLSQCLNWLARIGSQHVDSMLTNKGAKGWTLRPNNTGLAFTH